MSTLLGTIDQKIRKDFETNHRVLAFEEYLKLVTDSPATQLRGSAQYAADMMDYFGREPVQDHKPERFKLFDLQMESGTGSTRRVVGQEQVQHQIYRALKTFSRQKFNNKLVLLHGPNGSAKTSLIHALMTGLEKYSSNPDGALYSFQWIFPVDKVTKGGIGINTYSKSRETIESFAHLPDEEISARMPCDLRDHPILLVPASERLGFLENLLGREKARAVVPLL